MTADGPNIAEPGPTFAERMRGLPLVELTEEEAELLRKLERELGMYRMPRSKG